MGCFARGGNRVAPTTEQRVEQVVEPKVPVVDIASIRQSVASLARDKADAGKVLDTISATTPPSSLGYERAHRLTSEHGLNRQFGRGQQIHDYYRDVKGDLHLDFSKTQDASYRNEQVVYQTRGPLGRVRQHVVTQNVQTLISEKVRLDCDLSPKLAIDVGQSDTVFISAAHQKGDKQISFSQKDGGGSLAIVVGKDQQLRGVTLDTNKQIATITTDKGTITVIGVANPSDLRIGRDRGAGQSPAFVAIDAVATMTREGREANYQADAERMRDMLKQGGAIAAKVRQGLEEVTRQVTEQVTEYAQRVQLKVSQPTPETSPSDRIPTPSPSQTQAASSTPAPSPTPAPTLRPIAKPAPIPAGETLVAPKPGAIKTVQDLIAKNEEVAREVAKRFERSQEAQREIAARIAAENERLAFAELKENVNQILESRGEKPARSAEISTTRSVLHVDPDKSAPAAEEIATALVESRAAARAQVEKMIRDSMQTISSEASLGKVKEWADKNMTLFGTLNEDGRKAFIDQIKRDWRYGAGRESFEPQEFFDSRLAFVASMEIKSATRSVTTYMPPSSRPGPFTPVTHYVPDIAKISEVVRSLQDKPKVVSMLGDTPAYKEIRNTFKPKSFFTSEPSVEQRSLDARMKGDVELAEALLVRALIDERRVFTTEDRKIIADVIGTEHERKSRITKLYHDTYGTDIREDLIKLNKAAIDRAERTKKDLAEQERKAREARETVGDLLDY